MANKESSIVAQLVQARELGWKPTLDFLTWAGRQSRTLRETNIDELQDELKISKTEMYELVRGMLQLGIAGRTIGRHGKSSRLHWRYSLPDIDRCSKRKSTTLEPLEPTKFVGGGKSSTVEHVLRLRPDFTVKLPLPKDLTAFEVERLKKFIETCRMEDQDEAL